ncbi:MAG: PadR family transcriptional regulator [Terriglobia bacterium]
MFHGHRMHHGGRRRFFERGALKYLILDAIGERPRHGYDIIREIEERTEGLYSPSPGTVYPTLQMLEDVGHAALKKENGKKVYGITEEGRAYLAKHKGRVKEHRERLDECCSPKGAAAGLMYEVKRVFKLTFDAARRSVGDKEKVTAIKDILARTKKDIEQVLKT